MDATFNQTPPNSPLRDDTDARLPAAAYLRYQSRADGWSAGRQAAFLAHLADNGVVEDAARAVGMSVGGGYALRRTSRGYAFNLGWEAALIIARRIVADRLMTAAIKGEEARWVREEGVTTYTRQNTKLSLTLLDRVNPATTLAEVMAVATRFDLFLQLIDDGVSAQEYWDYLFDDALPQCEGPARDRVRAALLLTEESAVFELDDADDDSPIEYKSMDGPRCQGCSSFVTRPVMPALDQSLRDAGRDQEYAEIIEIPDRDIDDIRPRQRPEPSSNQEVADNEHHRARAHAIAWKIAAPRHRGHDRQYDAIGSHLNRFFSRIGQHCGDDRRQNEQSSGQQFLAEHRFDPPVAKIDIDRHNMANRKGQPAGKQIQLQQAIAQRVKGKHDCEQDKLALMMPSQRKRHKQTDRSHFPDDREQPTVEWQQQPSRREADACNKAGKQPRSFMREILPHRRMLRPNSRSRQAEYG